jgi:hypothetical protein
MVDTDVAPRRRRITVWAVLMMLGVSLVNAGVFFGGFLMWLPSMMVVAANEAGGMTSALMYWLMAGPVFGLLGLLAGWIGFFFRPRTGLLLGLFIPLAWVISVIAIFVQAEGRCGGDFWC